MGTPTALQAKPLLRRRVPSERRVFHRKIRGNDTGCVVVPTYLKRCTSLRGLWVSQFFSCRKFPQSAVLDQLKYKPAQRSMTLDRTGAMNLDTRWQRGLL